MFIVFLYSIFLLMFWLKNYITETINYFVLNHSHNIVVQLSSLYIFRFVDSQNFINVANKYETITAAFLPSNNMNIIIII